ncbi:MAG TPA: hypothetical protein VL484_02770 [Vicinamibacterales bacterium]|nr:hypothetical protein [Vicinamibacterales bacterium]
MTVSTHTAGVAPMNLRPGLLLAALFLCVYGGLALTVNFPKAAIGFQSDEATYYMMGYSLADDGDLAYRREDLVRVWHEFPSGPAGVFLKKGRTLAGAPDPDASRYYYGKAFIYPLVAAPFVKIFGTNGFLVLHAFLVSFVLLCGYLFLHARASATASALLAGAFVMASVVPVYFVWIMPELFNFTLAFLAYFCWLYKEVADPLRSPRGTAWLFTRRSDLLCGVLLGIDTFSKPTNALLFAAPMAWWLYRALRGDGLRIITRTLVPAAFVFLLCAGGLFAANMAISGEWNYQGGDRNTYYFEFPFQNAVPQHDLGQSKSREGVMGNIIFNPRTFRSNLAHNLEYFFVGRYTGLVGYFFPAVFAMAAFLAAPRRRPGWQWLVLAAGLMQGLMFIVATPYTWHGGGVGNRYFFSGYGVMLFVMPPIESIAAAFLPWVAGGLFVGAMVLNPFVASFRPADNAKRGLLRAFPVELTLVNDLPVNTDPDHARLWFGDNAGQGDPGFLVYFLDDNAYGREADKSFWTRGESTAEFIIKTDRPMRRAIFALTSGPRATTVTVTVGGRSEQAHLAPNQTQQVAIALPPGTPFEKEVHALVWLASVSCDSGFTPIFVDAHSSDSRYLGVRVHPVLELQPE